MNLFSVALKLVPFFSTRVTLITGFLSLCVLCCGLLWNNFVLLRGENQLKSKRNEIPSPSTHLCWKKEETDYMVVKGQFIRNPSVYLYYSPLNGWVSSVANWVVRKNLSILCMYVSFPFKTQLVLPFFSFPALGPNCIMQTGIELSLCHSVDPNTFGLSLAQWLFVFVFRTYCIDFIVLTDRAVNWLQSHLCHDHTKATHCPCGLSLLPAVWE